MLIAHPFQPKVSAKDQPQPGQYAATGSRDKTIKLWDATGQCIHTLVSLPSKVQPEDLWTSEKKD
jgi:WD40 repeat protein